MTKRTDDRSALVLSGENVKSSRGGSAEKRSSVGDHLSERSSKSPPNSDNSRKNSNLKGQIFSDDNDGSKTLQEELLRQAEALEAEEKARNEKNKNSIRRKIQNVVFKTVALIIAVGVVGLCVVSAVLSIKKLLDTKDKPTSTYSQKLLGGPYLTPGLIFLGEDILLHSCSIFNFTSLNVDSHQNATDCPTNSFLLDDKSSLDQTTLNALPKFLQELQEVVSLTLIPGPSDWENRETIQIHASIPSSKAGIWVILHSDYEEVAAQFSLLEEGGISPSEKWELTSSLILENSMNFASAQFRSFFLMSKQQFKSFGALDAVRIDMEITLMEQNKTDLDSLLGGGRPPQSYVHMEAFYQWKDGFYMEGDQFLSVTIWAIFTIMASALLMLERGYNTLKRVLTFKISDGPSKKQQQQQIEDQLHKEEKELNERQRAFDEANAADSRPSTAHSELGLTDAELDFGEDEGKDGYEEVDFDIFKADNK